MFWASRERAYLQTNMSTTKEAELIKIEEFGDPKGTVHQATRMVPYLKVGNHTYRLRQHRGPVHASMLTFEGDQIPRDSYSICHSLQQ